MVTLKSFPDNSNISGILVWLIVFFSIQDGIFLILGMMSDFQLKFGTLGILLRKSGFYLNPSMLAAFIRHCSCRGQWSLPHSCQVRVEVQVPHLPPHPSTWLAWWGLSYYCSPCFLHWHCIRGGEITGSSQSPLTPSQWRLGVLHYHWVGVDVCSDTEGGGLDTPVQDAPSSLSGLLWHILAGCLWHLVTSLDRMGSRPFMWPLLVGLA